MDNILPLRPPHEQVLTPNDRQYKRFSHAQFIAHLKTDMKFSRNGDIEFTLVVPSEYKHTCFALSDAFGMPLSVDVQLWKPYAEG